MRISFFSWLFFLFAYPLQLHFCVLGTFGQCLGDEQSSLLQFKNGIRFDSDRSTKLGSWIQSSECCLWEGVTCSKGRVVGLRLSNESISGRLENSSSLFKLHYLQFLDLSNNFLEGSFPISLFSFPSLLELQLSNNQFSGQLDELVNVSSFSLDTLDLSGNKLEGPIPTSFFQLKGLKILSLSSNNFNGSLQPSIFQQLMNLSYLDLSYNSLSIADSETNSSFSTLPWLWTLKLASNKLKTFPSFLRNQSELIHLDLSNNEMHGEIPDWTWRLRNLYSLNLSHNNLVTTNLPPLNLSFLSILDLHSNQLQGQLSVLPPNAIYLDFSSNNISSIIPASVGKFPIKDFSRWKAMVEDKSNAQLVPHVLQFEGFPMDVYYRDSVTVTMKGLQMELVKIQTVFTSFDFSCNDFVDPIPGEIEELKSLKILNLSHNAFTGEIPPSLGKLSNLESLDLSNNKLIGEIPVQLAEGLTFLAVLNLSFNQLVGRIPQIKQFGTFVENSYEGNLGLCGLPLKESCTHEEPSPSPPTSGNGIDWNFLSIELGYIFGLWIVIGPLMFWKRWRIWYCKNVDDILFRIFPQLYLGKEYRRRQVHGNQRQRL